MTKVKEAIEAARGNDDLWDSLDKIVSESGPMTIPSNSFCQEDFRNRYNIDRNAADRRIRKLKEDGKLVVVGRFGNKTYYQLVKS